MDFNTGSSGSGGGAAPPPPPPSGGMSSGRGSEFTLSNPVGSFVDTVRGVILSPVTFYRGIRKSGDLISPLVFALICAVIYGFLAAIVGLISNLIFGGEAGGAIGGFFVTLIATPIFSLIGLFIGAGIYHLVTYLLVKPNAGFEATFRVLAYTYSVLLVAWIPILGLLLSLYSIVLAIFGIREVHNTSTGRAVAVILIPTAVAFIIGLIFFVAIIAIIAAAMGGSM